MRVYKHDRCYNKSCISLLLIEEGYSEMAFKDFIHAKENRIEKERLSRLVEELGALEYSEVQKKTEEAKATLSNLTREKEKRENENAELRRRREALELVVGELQKRLELSETIEGLQKTITARKRELIVADEAVLMESFSLYKPTYTFTTADAYKEKLEKVRTQQKDMIKNDIAAFGSDSWRVNDSLAQGKKLVGDMKKLCLRSFNNECEAAVDEVKFNNFERCEARVEKSAEAVEKLGKMMGVRINPRFVQLKKDELRIALEYQTQKQREKDEQKELRAQMREEARVARELEEARKEALKEQQHYQNAVDKINKQIAACTDETELEVLKEKLNDLTAKLDVISENIAQIDYRQANQKAGYVYLISNLGAFGENVFKIGMTRRLEPQERIDELGDASVPFNFDIHAMIFSDNAPALEAVLHRTFSERRLNYINNRREFFQVTLDEIKQVIKNNHDKTVEFVEIPLAEQYRETIKMKQMGVQ